MPRSGLRRAARVAVATIAIGGALLRPVAAPPAAAAADDGLGLTSSSTYTLDPDKGLVHVAVALTAKNTKPNLVRQTPNGTLTTRYFFESATIAVHAEAANALASAGKTKLRTRLTPDDGFARLRVDLPRDLFFGETVTVSVAYDLPGGPPRSDSDIRVGSAFATFYAWAFGDGGDVQVVVPGGYDVETSGSPTEKSATGGVTTISATGIDDVTDWYTIVVADRHDALTRDRLDLADGEHLVIRAWPEDGEWRSRVSGLLRVGLPALVDKLGLDWPVEGDIEVSEVHTPLLEGYAGVFFTDENRIEISEDLDELTIIHEASHAWFNEDLIAGRWIDEGLADEYASRVLDEVSNGGLGPESVAPTSAAAVRLNEWTFPGRIADDATEARETYGYEASWTAMRALIADAGEAGMREVLGAASRRETPYVGAGAPETLPAAPDWRRFLDLLEERGGAAQAEAIFRRWVVTDDEAALLGTRDAARDAYSELVAVGDGWMPGWAVREPLGRWDFTTATAAIDDASGVLTTRRQIEDAAVALELEPPGTLKTAYESEKSDLATVQALADRQLATEATLADAGRRAAAERPPLTGIGLLGTDPDAELASARAAFSAGDLDTVDEDLAAMTAILDGAVDAGRERVAIGGLAGTGVLAVVGVSVYAVRRRRRRVVAPAAVPEAPATAVPLFSQAHELGAEPSATPAASATAERATVPAAPRHLRVRAVTVASQAHPMATDASAPSDPYATLGDPPPAGAAPDGPADVDQRGDGT